jgi:hypothetical protein
MCIAFRRKSSEAQAIAKGVPVMFAVIAALAALAQVPEYVQDYHPKVGDKIVLARDEEERRVPIVKNVGAAMGFRSIIDEGDEDHYEAIMNGTEISEIDGGTPAQIVDTVKYLNPPAIFTVRILAGTSKGKTTVTYAQFCRKPNPAFTKAQAANQKKRGSLDKDAIAADIKSALAKADVAAARGDLERKKALVREAVNPLREKYDANFTEINKIATDAGIFAMIGGKKYDVAGNLIRN